MLEFRNAQMEVVGHLDAEDPGGSVLRVIRQYPIQGVPYAVPGGGVPDTCSRDTMDIRFIPMADGMRKWRALDAGGMSMDLLRTIRGFVEKGD